ncbi:hypothetical protein [Colwellia sp. MEBiC06753]
MKETLIIFSFFIVVGKSSGALSFTAAVIIALFGVLIIALSFGKSLLSTLHTLKRQLRNNSSNTAN